MPRRRALWGDGLIRGRTYGFPLGLMRSPRYRARAPPRPGSSRVGPRHPTPPPTGIAANYGPRLAERSPSHWWRRGPACRPATSPRPSFRPRLIGEPRMSCGSRWPAASAARRRQRVLAVRSPRVRTSGTCIPREASECCAITSRGSSRSVRLETPGRGDPDRGRAGTGVRVNGTTHEASAVVSTAPVHILAKLVPGPTHSAPGAVPLSADDPAQLRLAGRRLLPDVSPGFRSGGSLLPPYRDDVVHALARAAREDDHHCRFRV